jgi:poly(3-hydroxybutyrate) depolymerase
MDARSPLGCLLLCGTLTIFAADASAACTGATLASGSQALEVDGTRRTFILRVPAGYDGLTPAPVIVTFHPFGMSAQYMQARVSPSRTWPEAMTIHAEATGAPAAWQAPADTPANRDLDYFDALLDWLAANACTDPERLFVLGYSNGAQFASLLACVRTERIAAVASAAGRLPCTPADAVPVILSHGLGDRTIAYTEAVSASRAWAEVNRCVAPPRTGTPGCFAAESCGSAPVTLCTSAGGHDYDVTFTAQAIGFFRRVATAP